MKKIKNILLLAGGDSTRFWPLQEKNIIYFLNKPLIQHQVESLKDYAKNIFIVVNKNNKKIIHNFLKEEIILEQNPILTGQAGAILSAKNKIKGEILIVNTNDIFNINNMPRLIDLACRQAGQSSQNKFDVILMAKKMTKYFPGGYLKIDKNKVLEIIEKPDPDKVPSDIVRLVVDYIKDFNQLIVALESIKPDKDDWYEQGLNYLIKKLDNVSYLLYKDYWLTIKYPWQVLAMMQFFLKKIIKNKIDKSAQISSHAKIVPPVFFGKNVKIGDFVKIVGPVYIGDNSIIGDYVMIRESQIGSNCLIGGYSEVTRAYVGNNVRLHRNYIGDSVLADNVLMGAGAVTANFRFDEQIIRSKIALNKISTGLNKFGSIIGTNAKIGCNSTLYPGIKIGNNSWIKPGNIISQDIKDNSII